MKLRREEAGLGSEEPISIPTMLKDISEALVFQSKREMNLEDGYVDTEGKTGSMISHDEPFGFSVTDVSNGYDDSRILEVWNDYYLEAAPFEATKLEFESRCVGSQSRNTPEVVTKLG